MLYFRSNPSDKTGILAENRNLIDNLNDIYGLYYLHNPMNLPRRLLYRELEYFKNEKMFKRYDKLMDSDCSSHETGLAIALYSIAIRYQINKLMDN